MSSKIKSAIEYDVFISYQWDSKLQATMLARKLQDYSKNVFIDELGVEINQCRTRSKISQGIKSSKVFIILLTKNYCETINTGVMEVQEPYLAHTLKIPFIVLMLEHVNMISMGLLNVFLTKTLKFNCFNSPSVMRDWSGDMWNDVLNGITNVRRKEIEASEKMFKPRMATILALDMF